MQYCRILKLRQYCILSFSLRPIPLTELVLKRSFLFLFQTNFTMVKKFYGILKLFLNFAMVVNWKSVAGDYSLHNLLIKIFRFALGRWINKKSVFSFLHVKKSISQNYELLFHISLLKQSRSGALQK